jgi:endonuclease/exonuclease/phosphatase family metal-dependent hydrolase
LTAHAADLCAIGAPVVLAGDYNVAPTDLDIYPTKSWDRDALLQPESRLAYQRLLSEGWNDAIRALHPREPMYTFWDYMRNRWERDGGLRLDHILLSSGLTERLQEAGVDRTTRGLEGASDHAPVWVKLRDVPDHRGVSLRGARSQAPTAATTVSSKSGNSAVGPAVRRDRKRAGRALAPLCARIARCL